MLNKKKPAASAANETTFTKEALMKSKRFSDNRDLVSALLTDGAEYTVSEVNEMITEYLKGTVK